MGNEFRDLDVTTKVSIVELRRLLIGIKEHQHETGFRFRLMGELWHPAFLSVVTVSERTVMLLDSANNKLISVEFGMIMQFEIDLRYQEFSPNFHYTISHLK